VRNADVCLLQVIDGKGKSSEERFEVVRVQVWMAEGRDSGSVRSSIGKKKSNGSCGFLKADVRAKLRLRKKQRWKVWS